MTSLLNNVDAAETVGDSCAFVEGKKTYPFSLWPFLVASFIGVDTVFVMMGYC
jgi:hypothetical protein